MKKHPSPTAIRITRVWFPGRRRLRMAWRTGKRFDTTSGRETYGAGRYLDLEPEEDGTYVLDFNLAYHPSCVYDPRFSCPLTPAENRLPIRIEAGERLATED